MSKRKFKKDDRFIANTEDHGGCGYQGRTGTILDFHAPGEYKVVFDDAPEVIEHVYSHWIEPLLENRSRNSAERSLLTEAASDLP